MYERFTDQARRVVVLAQEEARQLRHRYIGTEHLLLGLIAEGRNTGSRALEGLGVDLETLRREVLLTIGRGTEEVYGHIPFTPRAKKVLELSLREALHHKHDHIGAGHVLLGLVREGEASAAEILGRFGVDLESARREVLELKGVSGESAPPGPAPLPERLAGWLRDLTEEARQAAGPTVAGRGREIEAVMRVLLRKSRNNALLVGAPGTGRTSVIIGLAERLARGEAPASLAKARIWAVDLAGFYWTHGNEPGDPSEKFRDAVHAIRERGVPVLFLDDLDHSLRARAGPVDLLRMITDFVERGEVRVIAVIDDEAAAELEARRPELARQTQTLRIDEPTHADTVAILAGLRPEYAEHHHVTITTGALEAIAALSARHLTGRLPGKAIELLDEVGAYVGMRPRTPDVTPEVNNRAVADLFAEVYGLEEPSEPEGQDAPAEAAPAESAPPEPAPPPEEPHDPTLWAMA